MMLDRLKIIIKNKIFLFINRKKKISIGDMSIIVDTQIDFLAQIRNNVFVNKSEIGKFSKVGDKVSINESKLNDFSYVSESTIITKTKIGKFCSIGPDCRIGLGQHPTKNYVSTHPVFFSTTNQIGLSFSDKNYFDEFEEITIGNDVWIGAGSIVVDGVTVNDGAIIGAGSVVTKDVPSYAIVGGVPAKIIRYRFEKEEIDFLLKFKWWNKEINWLRKNYLEFHDIKKLMTKKIENG